MTTSHLGNADRAVVSGDIRGIRFTGFVTRWFRLGFMVYEHYPGSPCFQLLRDRAAAPLQNPPRWPGSETSDTICGSDFGLWRGARRQGAGARHLPQRSVARRATKPQAKIVATLGARAALS